MTEEVSLWDHLASTDRPVFLYGTGNGGDKILDVLESRNIRPEGIFASDGFVRDRVFRGFPVRSYADVVEEYGDEILILLAFGSALPEVRRFLEKLDARHELIIPEVPLYGGPLFDGKYYAEHAGILEETRRLLADEESRALFDDTVRFRLAGKLKDLNRTEPWENTLSSLFASQKIRTVLDGGAFKGDSTELFVSALHPDTVYAVEADPRTFRKLSDYADSESRAKIVPVNAALLDHDGEMEYCSSASRGSGQDGRNRRAKTETVSCCTLDSLLKDVPVDLIKLDIEGSEAAALDGAETILRACEPNLAISLYHRTDDLFELPMRIHRLLPEHRLYLRRTPCIPLWDLSLYAVRKRERS